MSEPLQVAVLLRRLRVGPESDQPAEVLGACERAALAAAVTIAEERGATVTALAVGSAARENRVLAVALRAGCGSAVRLDDSACSELDYLGVARLLAAFARQKRFGLILCGARSQDEQQGAVGPALAEELGIPHAVEATDLHVTTDAAVVAPVPGSGLSDQRLPLPALVSISRFDRRAAVADDARDRPETDSDSDDNELAGGNRSRRHEARAATPAPTMLEISPDDLGVDPRELRHRQNLAGVARPRRRSGHAIVLATPADLVARLRADHLIDE